MIGGRFIVIIHVNTFGLFGIKGLYIDAEIDVSKGIFSFEIIGMGNLAVKEAAGRIKPAIVNMGYNFPNGRITVNLAPASIRKEGANFDLAIAIGILKSTGVIKNRISDFAFIGELSLDGYVRSVKGVLPMIQKASELGIQKCIVPIENADEASLIEKCKIYPASSLIDAVNILNNEREPWTNSTEKENCTIKYGDFADIKGQQQAVRAALIAAAGYHNILFIGAPGCGKTMIANRIPGIMPELTIQESMEVTPVYSVIGLLNNSKMVSTIPFRSVYPDVTKAGLIGGGAKPIPGEISLAHRGILFLDELAEFDRNVMQSLRQPMESGKIRMSRCGDFVEFPSDFMLVASSNPCKCGKLFEKEGCTCTPLQAKNYLSRISKPLLDRIDLHVPVKRINLNENGNKIIYSSVEIKKRVEKARLIQKERYSGLNFNVNGKMDSAYIKKYCNLSLETEKTLKKAVELSQMSMRGYEKILKVARTIADLDNSEEIKNSHIAESLQYRFLDNYMENQL